MISVNCYHVLLSFAISVNRKSVNLTVIRPRVKCYFVHNNMIFFAIDAAAWIVLCNRVKYEMACTNKKDWTFII